jgi:hypothetical protein
VAADAPGGVALETCLPVKAIHRHRRLRELDRSKPRCRSVKDVSDGCFAFGQPLEIIRVTVPLYATNSAERGMKPAQDVGGPAYLTVLTRGYAKPVPRRAAFARSRSCETEASFRIHEACRPSPLRIISRERV